MTEATTLHPLVYNPDPARYRTVTLASRRGKVVHWPAGQRVAPVPTTADAYQLTVLGPMTRAMRASEVAGSYGITEAEAEELAPLCAMDSLETRTGDVVDRTPVYVLDEATRHVLRQARTEAKARTAAPAPISTPSSASEAETQEFDITPA